MTATTQINIETESEYLESCARIRGISKRRLLQQLIDLVVKDQMIAAILDDADDIGKPKAKVKRVRATTTPALRPQLPHSATSYGPNTSRRAPLTKEQMRAELEQAVLNTGGRHVKLEERKEMFLEMLRQRGRVCPSDLGDNDQQTRWQVAMRQLVEEGKVYKNLPEDRTRRVYYELMPEPRDPLAHVEIEQERLDVPSFIPARTDA